MTPWPAAAHIACMEANLVTVPMPTPRDEARSQLTAPERLHELISLPGDRGDIDSDAGWCREFVAGNPAALPRTLAELGSDMDDVMCRRNVASNPSAPDTALRRLAADTDDIAANTARRRLGIPERTVNRSPYSPLIEKMVS